MKEQSNDFRFVICDFRLNAKPNTLYPVPLNHKSADFRLNPNPNPILKPQTLKSQISGFQISDL
jgi:hypothetical protein